MRRGYPGDLVPHVLGGTEAEIGAQLAGQLGGDGPIGSGGARRGDNLALTRDPPLQVGVGAPPFGEPGGGEHNVGPDGGRIQEQIGGHDGAHPVEGFIGQLSMGEIAQRIGAQQDQHVDLAVCGGLQDAAGVGSGVGGHRAPCLGQRRSAVGQGDSSPAAARAPSPCRALPARCPGAARAKRRCLVVRPRSADWQTEPDRPRHPW